MPIEIKRKEGESTGSFLYRFSKRVKQSGILKEVKRKRFRHRNVNRQKIKLSALYRLKKQKEIAEFKKYGFSSGKTKR